MQESDLSLLIEAARRASKIALPLAAGVAKCWEKGEDAGPVTEADIAVNQMLIAFFALREARLWLVIGRKRRRSFTFGKTSLFYNRSYRWYKKFRKR